MNYNFIITLLYVGYWGLFPGEEGGKQLTSSPLSSAEVKNVCSYACTPPYIFATLCLLSTGTTLRCLPLHRVPLCGARWFVTSEEPAVRWFRTVHIFGISFHETHFNITINNGVFYIFLVVKGHVLTLCPALLPLVRELARFAVIADRAARVTVTPARERQSRSESWWLNRHDACFDFIPAFIADDQWF
jgi:hypothetical protein